MSPAEVKVGIRVRSVRHFVSVPKGTIGVIDELYYGGCMVAWDLPHQKLPPGYREYPGIFEGPSWNRPRILRDGFGEKDYQFLEVVPEWEICNRKEMDNLTAFKRAFIKFFGR